MMPVMNKIFLVEDDEAIASTLRDILIDRGFSVDTFADGAEAATGTSCPAADRRSAQREG